MKTRFGVPRSLRSFARGGCLDYPVGVSLGMHQLALAGFARLRVQPTHLLPAGMKITSYNHHAKAPSFPRSLGPQTKTTGLIEPSLLSNPPFSRCVRKGGRLSIVDPAPRGAA